MVTRMTRRSLLRLGGAGIGIAVLGACAPQVVKETVIVEVEKEKVVKEVVKETVVVAGTPKVVEKTVEKVVTSQPAAAGPKLITYVDSAGFGVPQYQESIDPITKELSKKMQSEGVNLEFRVLVLDSPKDEYPLLYASGVPFTFAFDAQWKNMLSLREQGYLRPLESLLPQYKNIVEKIGQEVLDYNFMGTHLYGLPTGFYLGQTTGVVYRRDLLEKYKMPKPTSLDDLELFLAEVKKNEPGMFPFGGDKTFNAWGAGGRWHDYQKLPNFYGRGGEISGAMLDGLLQGKPGYIDSEDTDGFKASAERARQWADKEWINKNVLQIKDTTIQDEMFFPGKCAAITYNEPSVKAEQELQKGLEAYVATGKAAGLDTSGQREGSWIDWARFKQWNFQVFNSNMALEDTHAGLQFFDWLLSSQDNIDIWLFGIDGVNYKKVGDMGYDDVAGVDGATNYRRQWYVAGVPGRFQRIPATASEDYKSDLAYLTDVKNFMPNPIEQWEAARKPIETELAQLKASWEELFYPLAAGEVDVAQGIAALKKAANAAKRQECKAAYQAQLDQWISENKPKFDENVKKAQASYANWEKTTYADFQKTLKK